MSSEVDISTVAARGLAAPETITPDEVQSLCGWILPRADDPPPLPPMSDEVRAELTGRRAALKAKADKRRDEAGYAANVAELDAWIAELDAELAA